MNALEIVQSVGIGVNKALYASQLFLGVEQFAFENADIHPEYLTTVKVAEQLTGPSRVVSLETHMKDLRKQARVRARVNCKGNKAAIAAVDAALLPFQFGKKDSRRLDVLVRQSDFGSPPLLILEAKLGVDNLHGVVRDVDRIIRLFDMLEVVGLLDASLYGAAVFHLMEDGATTATPSAKAATLMAGVNAHLAVQKLARPWLNFKVGMLSHAQTLAPVDGYLETYDDGTTEPVFGKHGFYFAPGMVLLGQAADVNSVKF